MSSPGASCAASSAAKRAETTDSADYGTTSTISPAVCDDGNLPSGNQSNTDYATIGQCLPDEPCPSSLSIQILKQFKDIHWIRDFIQTYNHELSNYIDSVQLDEWLKKFKKMEEEMLSDSIAESSASQKLAALLDNPILIDLAKVLHNMEEYHKALRLLEIIYNRQESLFGADHQNTIKAQFRIALCLSNLQEYSKALKLYQSVYKKQKEIQGPNHEDTLRALHNIALIFLGQEKYAEALKKFEKVYQRRSSSLGTDHLQTLDTQFQIALCLGNLKRYDSALESFKLVYEKYKRLLGVSHAQTLSTQNNMAVVLVNQEKYEEALGWYRNVYAAEAELLGADHPHTLNTKENLERVSQKLEDDI